ncbi:MAG: hypothetical protein GMKNLPBB_01219 [Myxococcota bacterium]|nr:hypothetical protein [Myxococcota bacterium]
MNGILEFAGQSLAASGAFFVAVVLPVGAMCFALLILTSSTDRWTLQAFGFRGLYITGWLGVPVHELSHAAAAVLTGHRICSIKLFSPNPRTGMLGSVVYEMDPRNRLKTLIGCALIPIAPYFGGALCLWGFTWLMAPEALSAAQFSITLPGANAISGIEPWLDAGGQLLGASVALLQAVFTLERMQNPWFYLYLYLCVCVGAHLSPSAQDFVNWVPAVVFGAGGILLAGALVSWFPSLREPMFNAGSWLAGRLLGFTVLALIMTSLAAILIGGASRVVLRLRGE